MENAKLEHRRLFYRYPSGFGSQGGHDALLGLPRQIPEYAKCSDDSAAYLSHFDYVMSLTDEERNFLRSC